MCTTKEEALERASFLASARGGRPRATHVIGRSIELAYQGQTYTLEVSQIGPQRYRVEVLDRAAVVDVDRLNEFQSRLVVGGRRHQVSIVAGTGSYLVDVDGMSHRVIRDEAGHRPCLCTGRAWSRCRCRPVTWSRPGRRWRSSRA